VKSISSGTHHLIVVPAIIRVGYWLALRQLASSLSGTSKHTSRRGRYEAIGISFSARQPTISLNGTSKQVSSGERYEEGATFFSAGEEAERSGRAGQLKLVFKVAEGLTAEMVATRPITINATATSDWALRLFNMSFSFLREPVNVEHIVRSPTIKFIGKSTYIGEPDHLF
jgi:hypothetical protein